MEWPTDLVMFIYSCLVETLVFQFAIIVEFTAIYPTTPCHDISLNISLRKSMQYNELSIKTIKNRYILYRLLQKLTSRYSFILFF